MSPPRQSHPLETREACLLPRLLGSAQAPNAEQAPGLTPAARTGPQTQTGNLAVGSHGQQLPRASRRLDLALAHSGESGSLCVQVPGRRPGHGPWRLGREGPPAADTTCNLQHTRRWGGVGLAPGTEGPLERDKSRPAVPEPTPPAGSWEWSSRPEVRTTATRPGSQPRPQTRWDGPPCSVWGFGCSAEGQHRPTLTSRTASGPGKPAQPPSRFATRGEEAEAELSWGGRGVVPYNALVSPPRRSKPPLQS